MKIGIRKMKADLKAAGHTDLKGIPLEYLKERWEQWDHMARLRIVKTVEHVQPGFFSVSQRGYVPEIQETYGLGDDDSWYAMKDSYTPDYKVFDKQLISELNGL